MSGIITSFFIEPVVRQARRFSTAPRADQPSSQCSQLTKCRCVEHCDASQCHHHLNTLTSHAKNNNDCHIHQLDPSDSSAASVCSNQRARARSSSLQLQLPEQSHVSHRLPTACSLHRPHATPASDSSTPTLALNSPRDKLTCPSCSSSRSSPTTAPQRRPVLSLGQTLFDRFAPLVSTRFSPFSSSDSDPTGQLPSPSRQPADAPNSGSGPDGSANPDQSGVRSEVIQHPIASVATASDQISDMDRRGGNGLRPPSLDRPASDITQGIDMPPVSASQRWRRRIPSRHAQSSRLLASYSTSAPESTVRAELGGLDSEPTDLETLHYEEQIAQREGELRRKIQATMLMDLTTVDRARRIHDIMNASYLEIKGAKLKGSSAMFRVRPQSSDSINSTASQPSSVEGDVNSTNSYNLQPSDLIPTFRNGHPDDESPPRHPQAIETEDDDDDAPDSELDLGCEHYKRNIKIQCFDCKSWWNCRYCHDAADLGHQLPRHKTENMLCMLCQTPGPAGQYCGHCGALAAYYFCEICKLWEDDSTKKIYHCTDCGICRKGEGIGKDFFHCSKCNVCLPVHIAATHKCIERATDCDCPICGEYMFNSVLPIVANACGHYLHRECYDAYIETNYQCPICKRSVKNMGTYWRKLDDEVERQPMPDQYRNARADIKCNDCGGRGNANFHWVGHKCTFCDSYNTVVLEVTGISGQAPDNTTRTSPPRGSWRNGRTLPQSRVRRYFVDDDENEANGGVPASGEDGILSEPIFGLGSSAYEVLAAMSRNLSPIRRYLNSGEVVNREPTGPVTEEELEQMGFWNDEQANGNNGNEDDDEWEDEEDEDEDEESDSSESEVDFLFDDDSDSSSEGGLDISLIGHR